MATKQRPRRGAAAPSEAEAAAQAASLRHVSDHTPGIARRRAGQGVRYVSPDGKTIRNGEVLARIRALAIPPAWTDVWICPTPNGHIQATGRDARGRKQYRYHARWREVRDANKYDRLIAFGRALPKIRAQVRRDLAKSGLPREKVVAAVVRLLETTMIRVGNDEYARTNGSFGLTTLRDRHVRVRGGSIEFRFRGKGGRSRTVTLDDRRLARMVKQCRDLPGQQLFQYDDGTGTPQGIGSADVNDYLRAIAGEGFTAKDFRTWAGTLAAAGHLRETGPVSSRRAARSAIVRAAERVSEQLGNTPAISRKCYIHPDVLDAHQDATLFDRWRRADDPGGKAGLRQAEAALLRFLRSARAARRTRGT